MTTFPRPPPPPPPHSHPHEGGQSQKRSGYAGNPVQPELVDTRSRNGPGGISEASSAHHDAANHPSSLPPSPAVNAIAAPTFGSGYGYPSQQQQMTSNASFPPPPIHSGSGPLLAPVSSGTSSSQASFASNVPPQRPPPPPAFSQQATLARPPAAAPMQGSQAYPPPPPPTVSDDHASSAYGMPPPPPQQQIRPPSVPPQHHMAPSGPSAYPPYGPPPPGKQMPPPAPPPATTTAALHGRPAPPPSAPSGYQEQPKIDPSQIPRPPLFTRPQDGPPPLYYPGAAVRTVGGAVQVPPPADSRYLVQDDGNASPDVIRSSVYAFPQNRGVWHHTGDVPLGVLCTPLAVLSEDFVPRPRVLPDGSIEDWQDPQRVPLVTSTEPPPRCGNCQAYVNPFFEQDGTCNLCGSRNNHLKSALSSHPVRYGAVEYEVDGPYVTRKQPVEPIQLYVLDLTCPSLRSYLPILEQLAEEMAQHYWRQPDSRLIPRMGICFVSSAGIILHGHEDQDRYTIMSDVTVDPFCPLPLEDWTFDLSMAEGLEAFRAFTSGRLIEDFDYLKRQTKGKNAYGMDGMEVSCGGVALAFLANALADTGGRGTVITWRRPTFGVGRIPHREERPSSNLQTRFDYPLYTPLQLQSNLKIEEEETAASFYKELGERCVKNRVSLDVLVHNSPLVPQAFLDLATLGEVCRITSGKLMWIKSKDWEVIFHDELSRQLQCFSGWDAVFKVRCSAGIQVKSFLSSGGTVLEGLVGSPELELASLLPSTCIGVELDHRVGGIPTKSPYVFVQTALLYSSLCGKRRMRVSTFALRTSAVVNEIFKSIDMGAMITLLLREAAVRMRAPVVEEERDHVRSRARDMIYQRCVFMLASYRKHTPAMNSPTGQLILPDKLQLLPLFCMSLFKSPMFRSGIPRRDMATQSVKITPTGDDRAFFNFHVGQVGPALLMLMVHPNVFSITSQDECVGEWRPSNVPDFHGYVQMPAPTVPSMESIDDDAIYLLDGGLTFFVYIGMSVSEEKKQDVLSDSIIASDSLTNRLVWQLKTYTSMTRGSESEIRPNVPNVVTVIQQDDHQAPMEPDILNLMVIDSMVGEKDYVDFLCTLHRRVRERVDAS